MRRRWTLVSGLTDNWWKTGSFDPVTMLQANNLSATHAVEFWQEKLLGLSANKQMTSIILEGVGFKDGQAIGQMKPSDLNKSLRRIAAFIAMSPEFQLR